MYKKVKKYLFFILVLATTVYSQPRMNVLQSEYHIFPNDTSVTVYYSYRIAYNRFVFIKNDDEYNAKYRLAIEVTDSLGNHIDRQIEESKITTKQFKYTDSKDSYVQGLIKFKLPHGKYNFSPILTDLDSEREAKLEETFVNASVKELKNYRAPIIVNSKKISCNSSIKYELTNYDGAVPFSETNYSFLFPVQDTSLHKLFVKIVSDNDTLFDGSLHDSFVSGISFDTCAGYILIGEGNSTTRNFVLNNISNKLPEGVFNIFISSEKDFKNKKTFSYEVRWFDKPFLLIDPEVAIKLLKFIETDSVVDKLLDADSDNYYKVLNKYWKKYDPTPETLYNPVMNEFYRRADYATKNFATLSGKSGLKTDRGQIFLKYGVPAKIERTSNSLGRVVEKWIFDKPQRTFVFVDEDGTGTFHLKKG